MSRLIPLHNQLAVVTLIFTGFFIAPAVIRSQTADEFLGIRLRPEVQALVKEIEIKTRKKIHAEFIEEEQSQLGSSFIDDETGAAVVLVDQDLEDNPKKLEAVIAHELLHLRLRVNNYPTFLFSPNVRTAKGRAIDVEQDNINDLLSIIEHQVFKADMERFGLYKYIDLAGDTAADARNRKGGVDGQADAINYARAILEYGDPKDIALVKQLFQANKWNRSLQEGQAIADSIRQADARTPKDVQTVFLKCLLTLYTTPGSPVTFRLTTDTANKYFLRMTINTVRAR